MSDLRIASFLPSGTEMVCALGLGDQLVGISHECDHPPGVRVKPVVVRCAVDMTGMSTREIDVAVSNHLRQGKSLYELDEEALRKAAPDLIVTQDLCQVCAPSGNEVTQVLAAMKPPPEIIWQSPKTFEDVLQDFLKLGQRTGREAEAMRWIQEARGRIEQITRITQRLPAPTRVCFLEWVDPLYCGGHWIPEMVRWAGGSDPVSRNGTDSVRVAWDDILQSSPEVLVVSPCGYDMEKALKQSEHLKTLSGWKDLPAVRNGRVYAVDGNSYFARPGPRLVDGVELLAYLIHPEHFEWNGSANACRSVV